MINLSKRIQARTLIVIAIDPDTGKRTKAVFACSWQDQPIEIIDLDHLASREKQNNCQETLNRLFKEKQTF